MKINHTVTETTTLSLQAAVNDCHRRKQKTSDTQSYSKWTGSVYYSATRHVVYLSVWPVSSVHCKSSTVQIQWSQFAARQFWDRRSKSQETNILF